jgi:hypothetical protein
MGVPETASVALGTALDVAADPSLGLYKVPGIMRKAARYAAPAAKARRYGQAAWLGASDVAPPVFFNIGGRMVAPVGPLDPVSEQAGPVLRGLLPQ